MTSESKKIKAKPSWDDVKEKFNDLDRTGLLQLLADLYAADKNNQSFLHTRFSLGGDPLEIYKKRIYKALFPNVLGRNPVVKIVDAKKAISEYQKANAMPDGVLELRLYFCEVALAFASEYGYDEVALFNAIFLQFKNAVKALRIFSDDKREDALDRLYDLCHDASSVGYGLEDDMAVLLEETFPDDERNQR